MSILVDYSCGIFRCLLVNVRRVLSSVRRFCLYIQRMVRVDRYHRQPACKTWLWRLCILKSFCISTEWYRFNSITKCILKLSISVKMMFVHNVISWYVTPTKWMSGFIRMPWQWKKFQVILLGDFALLFHRDFGLTNLCDEQALTNARKCCVFLWSWEERLVLNA